MLSTQMSTEMGYLVLVILVIFLACILVLAYSVTSLRQEMEMVKSRLLYWDSIMEKKRVSKVKKVKYKTYWFQFWRPVNFWEEVEREVEREEKRHC